MDALAAAVVAEEEARNLLGFTAGLDDLADGLLEEAAPPLFVDFSVADAGGFSLVELDMVVLAAALALEDLCLETPVPGIFRRSCRRFSISLFLVSKVFKVFSLSLLSCP